MSRADAVQGRFEEIDALLVTEIVNVQYLTGFTGSNGLCVVGPGLRRFVTDFRYVGRAEAEVDGFDRERGPQEFLAALSEGWPDEVKRIGFEDHKLTVRQHKRIAELLPDGLELVPAGGLVEAERAVKADDELERIAAAAGLADAALDAALEEGLRGRTERQVALSVEDAMRRLGGEPAFATIVAAGENGARPHAEPRDVAIGGAELVTIDFGARLDGYCSDCTRTYASGEVSAELADIHELVRRAQLQALAAIAPGIGGRDVDAIAREVIAAEGHGDHFGHGLGHGVGLEVHETPRLAASSTDTLAAGNVVTVEPGVYVPGLGGVRIEDLVVVTSDGPRVLSGHAKELTTV